MRSPRRTAAPALLLLLAGPVALPGCKADPCAGVSCPIRQTCAPATGLCQSSCALVRCAVGEACDEGSGTCREAVPPRPAIGPLIDRVGRPAVSTILLNPFDLLRVDGALEDRETTRLAYNSDGDEDRWTQRWAGAIASGLAVYDALDGMCGNNLAADAAEPRYRALSAALADDQIYLDVNSVVCRDGYFGIEAKALARAAGDCDGRPLRADVIDATYSLAATPSLTGLSDGVDASANLSMTFPFLGAPRD